MLDKLPITGITRIEEVSLSGRVLLFTADKNHAARAMFAGAGFRRTMIEMTREIGDD